MLACALLLGASFHPMADPARYVLSIEAALREGTLSVSPRLEAPPGSVLRYEIVSVKEGSSGSTRARQSGRVIAGRDGVATLATLRLGVAPADRCEVAVTVYEGQRIVAERIVRYPP